MMGFLSKYSERSTKIRMILLSMAGDWAGKIYDLFQKMNIAKIIMGALGVGDSTMSSISKSLINFSVSASEIFQGLGLALALLFFLIAMLELITQDRFNLEFFIKFFGKLVLSIALITVSTTLTHGIIVFGDKLAVVTQDFVKTQSFGDGDSAYTYSDEDETYNPDTDAGRKAYVKEVEDTDPKLWDGIMTLLQYFIFWIFTQILTVVIYIVCMTRLIEMATRAIFMPIAFALLSDDGWRGAGGRYIRRFLAICAQGAVIAVIGIVGQFIIIAGPLSIGADGNGGIMMRFLITLGCCFATVSLMFKSIGIINDVFGA